MGAWIISIEGTEAGRHLAMLLALGSAVLHASFSALQKGRINPWIMRGTIDLFFFLIGLPVALFLVPWPEAHMWPIFAGVFAIHLAYKIFLAMAYTRGDLSFVYPVMRGTSPLLTVLGASLFFAERYAPLQWAGVLLLSLSISGLAFVNIRAETLNSKRLYQALAYALITGLLIAIYTVYDAYGIRATANPFTFLAWFFVIDGIAMPFIALFHWRQQAHKPALGSLLMRGFMGALIGMGSFGAVILATRLDKIGEAAVLRETSVVFAALIAYFFLGEKLTKARALLLSLIATGAVLIEFG